MNGTKIEEIVKILKEHEDELSDGYAWYCCDDEDNTEEVEEKLKEIATEILRAIGEIE